MTISKLSREQVSIGVLIILHVVGVIGMLLAKSWFIPLTPLNLIVSAWFVLRHSPSPKWNLFVLIALLAFGIEAIGVATGFPFGDYSYERALGPKIIHVPVLIGLLWLLLLMGALNIAQRISGILYIQVVLVGLMMTGIDLLIEPIAIDFAYWQWYGEEVPINNYIAWFITAVILISIARRFDKNFGNNNVAGLFFITMMAFFISLNLLLL